MPSQPLTDEQREIRDLVRDLSRERIAPRAAEIDKSAEFPWDVVELFREHELLRAALRRGARRHRHGRAHAARRHRGGLEGLRDLAASSSPCRSSARSGIKLAGTEEQKAALPAAARERRVARGLRADRAGLGLRLGRDAHRGAARGRRVRPQRRQALHHERGRGARLHRLRQDRPGAPATRASRRSSSRPTRPASRSAASSRRWASRARRPASCFFDDCRIPAGQPARRGGRGLQDRDARARPLAAGGRRAGARHRAGRHRLRARVREERARRWASRSRSTSSSRPSSPTWRRSCEAARGLLYKVGQMIDEGVDGAELTKASAHGEAASAPTRPWT